MAIMMMLTMTKIMEPMAMITMAIREDYNHEVECDEIHENSA